MVRIEVEVAVGSYMDKILNRYRVDSEYYRTTKESILGRISE